MYTTITRGNYRIKFHDAGGFATEVRIEWANGGGSWVVDDDHLHEYPAQLLQFIAHLCPDYPLADAIAEDRAKHEADLDAWIPIGSQEDY